MLLAWSSANRDPAQFEDADDVVLTRWPNRHTAFGMGIHRCAGAHVGRAIARELIGQVIRRMPDYVVDVEGLQTYPHQGVNAGYQRIPATFTPGPRLGRTGDPAGPVRPRDRGGARHDPVARPHRHPPGPRGARPAGRGRPRRLDPQRACARRGPVGARGGRATRTCGCGCTARWGSPPARSCSGCTGAVTCSVRPSRTTRCSTGSSRGPAAWRSPSTGDVPPSTRTRPPCTTATPHCGGRRRSAGPRPGPRPRGGGGRQLGRRRRGRAGTPGPRPGRVRPRGATARLPDARRPGGHRLQPHGHRPPGLEPREQPHRLVGLPGWPRGRGRAGLRGAGSGHRARQVCHPPGSRPPSWTSSATRTSTTPRGCWRPASRPSCTSTRGGVHGFDLFAPEAALTRRFCRDRDEALDRFLVR